MNKEKVIKILSDLEAGYDTVADKFSGTRAFMWRDLEFIKDMVKPGDRILDFGCGNGRLAGFLQNDYQDYAGVDISQKLIDIAKHRYSNEKTKFIKISILFRKLPFEDNHFDAIFSIAVFHHFPSKKYALKIAKELHRLLRPGGKIVVTVWHLWQKQYIRYHDESKKEQDWTDAIIPFKSGGDVFYRYHHPFKTEEFRDLFESVGFKTIETKVGYNLLYIGEKSDVDRGGLTGEVRQ